MSFPRYERYKDSGVEWLGEVPEHWGRTRVKHIARPGSKTFIDGDWIEAPYITTEGVRLLQCGNVGTGVYEEQGFRYVSEETFRNFDCTEVEPNDVLICRLQSSRTILAGRACLAPQLGVKMITSVDNCIVKPSSDFDPRYIVYQLSTSAYLSFIEVVARGGTRDRISRSMLGDIELVAAPIREQRAIADFLDYETVKIDVLMEEQRRLIELLKEKRQAVISHAVTKGLNPHASMKDSGIEWLGEIPAHWTLARVKHLTRIISKGTTPTTVGAEFTNSGIRFLKAENITAAGVSSEPEFYISEESNQMLQRSILEENDVLVVIAGATTGKSAVLRSELVPANTNQAVSFLRLENPGYATFLNYWLSMDGTQKAVLLDSVQSAQPNLSMEDLGNLAIVVPPLSEVADITQELEHYLVAWGELVSDAEKCISILQERRTSLVSAAVTGKIDVREGIAVSSEVEKSYSTGFARQLLAAEILHDCYDHPTTGRVKLQKLIHLCEYVAEIDEINGNYLRKAAGPFDNKVMFGIASGLLKQKWFSEVKDGNRTIYRPLEKAGEHKKYLARWASKMPKIHEVLGLLGKADTQQCEIVSTLYAAWNDLLIEGRAPSEEKIIHEASDPVRWHENKAKIPSDKWPKALHWMRDHGLVPKGYGNHTRRDDVVKEPA